ncbi:MAG TPA: hypothetical protein DDE71_06390 [Tenacibaculum sp.]|nr:hypothetical protein [Tenacibaculum sp.]
MDIIGVVSELKINKERKKVSIKIDDTVNNNFSWWIQCRKAMYYKASLLSLCDQIKIKILVDTSKTPNSTFTNVTAQEIERL